MSHCCLQGTGTIASSRSAAACPACTVEHSKHKHQPRSCLLCWRTCSLCRHNLAAEMLQVGPQRHHDYDMG